MAEKLAQIWYEEITSLSPMYTMATDVQQTVEVSTHPGLYET